MRTSMLKAVLAVTIVGMACTDDVTAPVTAFESVLIALNEVPATNCGTPPAPLVPCTGRATGTFTIGGTATAPTLTYTITMTAGTFTAVTQAHLHTGAAGANGNIAIWLCESATNPNPVTTEPTPTCAAGTAAGVLATLTALPITAAQVTSMRAFGLYANVHTTQNTGGEIRGQVRLDP